MKIIFGCLIAVMLAVVLVMIYHIKNKNTDINKALIRLTYAVVITVIANVCALVIPSDSMALAAQSIYFIGTEWVLIFLWAFLERYTMMEYPKRSVFKFIIWGCAGICSIYVLLNIVFGYLLYCETVNIDGENFRIFHTISPWYDIHAYFTYFTALCCLGILVYAWIRTKSFYRVRYYPAVIAMCITLGIEVICHINNTRIDYSLFGFIGLDIFLIYHTVYHVFKGVITKALSYIASDAQTGVICFDMAGKCLYANDIMWKLYPEVSELSGFESVFNKYGDQIDINARGVQRIDIVRGEGENCRYYELTYSLIEDRKDEILGSYFNLYDKTDAVKALEEANYLATHDDLTGILNGGQFNQRVAEYQMSHDMAVDGGYVIAADIKDFKLINDLFSFEKGNEILIGFANAMQAGFSEEAVCSRLNSDHFAFFIPKDEYSEEKVLEVLEPVMNILSEEHYQLIFHFGVCEVTKSDTPPHILYDYARLALIQIKREYDKVFSYYDEVMMKRLVREKELVGEFDKALEEKQFIMYLQPQVKPDGTMVGAEALVRWKHPEQGMISPGEFISTFENASLIHKLDAYMWEQAAQKLSVWQELGKEDYYISVNISPRDFYYLDICKTLVDIVEKYKIDPSKLKLEITESGFMTDPDKQLELIAKLQGYGFHVEIDDFGSGFSSLNMLKDMKADVLKVDMGFLRKTAESDRAKVILDSIVVLAKRLNMVVVTEGVETKEQVDYLTEVGCDIIQGYYFCKPISIAEFEDKYFG